MRWTGQSSMAADLRARRELLRTPFPSSPGSAEVRHPVGPSESTPNTPNKQATAESEESDITNRIENSQYTCEHEQDWQHQ